jgi:hypothetical protein
MSFFAGKKSASSPPSIARFGLGAGELVRAVAGDPATGELSWPEQIATGFALLTGLIPAEAERAAALPGRGADRGGRS